MSIAMRLLAFWPISLMLACSVTPPKPYTPQNVDPAKPTYIVVPGWLSDWGLDNSTARMEESMQELKRSESPYVYLDVRGTRLRARSAGFEAPAPGEAVRIEVDTANVLWFDAAGGRRLR